MELRRERLHLVENDIRVRVNHPYRMVQVVQIDLARYCDRDGQKTFMPKVQFFADRIPRPPVLKNFCIFFPGVSVMPHPRHKQPESRQCWHGGCFCSQEIDRPEEEMKSPSVAIRSRY